MKRNSKVLMAIAALLLVGVYFVPIWEISLEAPQYPEGLGLEIWVNTVDGQNPHDLSKINNLNHYIGMKTIEPDAIAELKIMPVLIAMMIVLGLIAAFTGKRSLMIGWLVLFVILGTVGLYDFYLWEYDYGHNLDMEKAIIKVPGMTYQPPLIGSKQLLNFTATSLPGIGGYLMAASILFGLLAVFLAPRATQQSTSKKTVTKTAPALLLLSFLLACNPSPEAIRYGEATCARCKMMIMDQEFGTELVTTKGKIYTFDSIECLASFYIENTVPQNDVHSMWITPFNNPGNLVEVNKAVFLHSAGLPSPMGKNLSGYANRADAVAMQTRHGGDVLAWEDIFSLVSNKSANADQSGIGGKPCCGACGSTTDIANK